VLRGGRGRKKERACRETEVGRREGANEKKRGWRQLALTTGECVGERGKESKGEK